MKEKKTVDLYVVPHSHIDIEWYYTYETLCGSILKRIFNDCLLPMMREHPDYCFSQDQVPVFMALERNLPAEDLSLLRERIATGHFEIVGGGYVQSEAAEPSGESFIQQIYYGQRWFEEHFGVRAKVFWNTDVFGQFQQIPQILSKCGYAGFVFWRDIPSDLFDGMPMDFWYQSPDGSRILTHWMAGGYALAPHFYAFPGWAPGEAGHFRIFCDHARDMAETMIPWGDDFYAPHADNGLMERFLRNLGEECGVAVRSVEFGTPAGYFGKLAQKPDDLPVLTDDFNPPLQAYDLRGLYVARPELKRLNRACEAALGACETLYAMCAAAVPADPAIRPRLDEMWRSLLFAQFHDVIGGSCTDIVHERACESLRGVLRRADEICGELLPRSDGTLALINPASFSRNDPVLVESPQAILGDCECLGGGRYLIRPGELQALSASDFKPKENLTAGGRVPLRARRIENEFFILSAGEDGALRSIYDKTAGLEILSAPVDLVFMEETLPEMEGSLRLNGVEHSLARAPGDFSAEAFASAVRQCLRLKKPFMGDVITLEFSLYPDLRRVDCRLIMDDYKGGDHYIKLVFPFAEMDAAQAFTETSFACTLRRQGEIYPAQTWGGLVTPYYAAAVLNRAPAAYRWDKGHMELHVMRSYARYSGYRHMGLFQDLPEFLDGGRGTENAAEKGAHCFEYAIVSGPSLTLSDLCRQGHLYNHPVRGAADVSGGFGPLMDTGRNDVCVTACRYEPAEHSVGFRLYNMGGQTLQTSCKLALPCIRVQKTNLLFEEGEDIPCPENTVNLKLDPYQIAAFKVYMQREGRHPCA